MLVEIVVWETPFTNSKGQNLKIFYRVGPQPGVFYITNIFHHSLVRIFEYVPDSRVFSLECWINCTLLVYRRGPRWLVVKGPVKKIAYFLFQ